jgi:hypothetical protein
MLRSATTGPYPSLLPAAPLRELPAAQAEAWASWRAVHARLADQLAAGSAAPGFANLTVYQYCVHLALQAEPGANVLVETRFQQLTTQLEQQRWLGTWPLTQLDQACGAAWLSARLAQPAIALLWLDEALHAEAVRLQRQPDMGSRQCFFRVLRYFSLRLPASGIRERLQALLALPLHLPAEEPLPLGLVDGLAAELLLLLKLHKAGIQPTVILARLREGITQLLTLRRPVDFLETHYSIFPHHVAPGVEEAVFGAQLSWQQGDIGQSLLLYKAHEQVLDEEIFKIAELVGLNTLLRTTTHSTEITTSQLAQGAAGVAYLYAKLFEVGSHAAYRTGHVFWLGQTHKFLRQELASDFYRHKEGDLAHGLVGVSLVLLTSLTELELGWDTLVL